MPASPYFDRDMIEGLAFVHYLRTGHRADIDDLLAACERKFNPYHDEIGRFTFAQGASASADAAQPEAASGRFRRIGGSPGQSGANPDATVPSHANRSRTTSTGPAAPPSSLNGFRSALVRDAVSPTTSNADSYFELNKRQARLNQLRRDAGPNPAPVVRADLDDFQRRLATNPVLLDQRAKIADREVTEILRAGLAPVDIALGARNIAKGDGKVRDFLAVAGAIPLGGVIGKVVKLAKVGKVANEAAQPALGAVVQLGGPYKVVRRLRGTHGHHLVADTISPIPKGEGPSIAMVPEHHRDTASFGSKTASQAFRQQQADLVARNDIEGALQLGIDDIRSRHGELYDEAIKQAIAAYRKMGH